MVTSAIIVSTDSSDESMGSLPSRVILFGDIPNVIPFTSMIAPETSAIAPVISSAALVVETTLIASPTGLCSLVPYSDFDSDSPDEMDSPKYITPLPATSLFLYTDSSEASDSSDGPPLQDPYAITIARYRIRVTTCRPYRTRPNGPRRVMTVRKRVGPLPTRRLAWRHVSPRSLDNRPSSSSSPTDSSPVHSSGLDAPDQAHSGSLIRVVSPRLGYLPVTTPRHSEAFRRWCAALISTLCPPTSSGDSSERPLHLSLHSVGPSRKRCRFKDSYSSDASIEEDTEDDPTKTEVDMELGNGDGDDAKDRVEIDPRDVRDDTEEYEADTSAGDTGEVGIDPMSALVPDEESEEPAGEDSFNSSSTRDGIVRSFEDMPIELDDVVRDFYHHMSEVCFDRIVRIETVQRRLEANQLMAIGERARMTERIESLRLKNLKVRAQFCIERDYVDSLRLHMSRSHKEFRQICDDRDDLRRRTMTNTRSGMTPATIKEMINRRDGNGNKNGNANGNVGNGSGQGGNGNGDGRGDRPDAIRIANDMMDKKLKGYAVRNAENKRRLDANQRDNHGQQLPFKRQNTGGQNVARAYTAGNNETRGYVGPNQKVNTCFECGAPGHYRKDYPKIKNQNRGNKARIPEARGKAYVLGGGDANPGSNTITGAFLLNDHHAYMLFDSGADRSFVSNNFSALLDIIPFALDISYAVELADGRTS
uniref:CCHC-type domain-containing protein n=1 Tax=Tanacetum cinerariifolium TaxID=118510 RepID=A0A699H556_TANCI|nr:hypothetical protein [Tanacetum cinerariifolium]